MGGNSAYTLIMIVVLIAVFYLFMIRPESKRKKQQDGCCHPGNPVGTGRHIGKSHKRSPFMFLKSVALTPKGHDARLLLRYSQNIR